MSEDIVIPKLHEVETYFDLKVWFGHYFPKAKLFTNDKNEIFVDLNTILDLGGILFPKEDN